jgi:hypothetical protein
MLFATILDEGEELSEELLGPSKPVAKGAPHGQVIGEGLTEWTAPDFPEAILVEDYAAILGSSRVAQY